MRPLGSPADQEPWFPAELLVCRAATSPSSVTRSSPSILFPPGYPYTSGSTRVLRDNFADLAQRGRDELAARSRRPRRGHRLERRHAPRELPGARPSCARDRADRHRRDRARARDPDAAGVLRRRTRRRRRCVSTAAPRLVTAANVFAHIPDVHAVVDGGASGSSARTASFVSESHYLVDLIETLQYDTIYHEHLRYYSLTSLTGAARGARLPRSSTSKRIPTHGGSIRVYATKARRPARGQRGRLLDRRARTRPRRRQLDRRVPRARAATRSSDCSRSFGTSSRVALGSTESARPRARAHSSTTSASTTGSWTACSRSRRSKKLDKYLPGTAIPVLDERRLFEDQPEYALLLSWHIADELRGNLLRKGFRGDFVVPLPDPHIVTARGSLD